MKPWKRKTKEDIEREKKKKEQTLKEQSSVAKMMKRRAMDESLSEDMRKSAEFRNKLRNKYQRKERK